MNKAATRKEGKTQPKPLIFKQININSLSKYYAYELSRTGGKGVDRLGRALFDVCVDLNPYQIEAALFALRSHLSKGVLLADEVGLGKTIEAGLIICQRWAENQRKILVICPASLRKQWAVELEEKFNLPSQILDAKTHRDIVKAGNPNPFDCTKILICSMHFVAGKALDIRAIPWHLDALYFELEQFKREQTWYNLNINKAGIQKLLADKTWYTLFLPLARLEPTGC